MSNHSFSPVLSYPLNYLGRDFIVGDIHGAFEMLMVAMDRVKFDPDFDRLFSVGDLIDRGEHSALVLEFLKLPFVHAVRGNHEQMLLDIYKNDTVDEHALYFNVTNNGLAWWLDTPEDVRQNILNSIKDLPIAIEVETIRGSVGILHADIQSGMSWQEFITEIEAGNETVINTALWGRTRIKHEIESGVPGIDRVFVGHTPQWDGVNRFGNVYAIDTGAVFAQIDQADGAALTMMNMIHKTAVTLVDHGDALNILNTPVFDQPFGQYAMRSRM